MIYTRTFSGKVIVITGSTTGIGEQVAHVVAQYNATLIMLNRRPDASRQLASKIKAETKNENIHCVTIDLADFSTFRQAVQDLEKITDHIDIFSRKCWYYCNL